MRRMTVTVEHASGHLNDLLKELAHGPITLTDGDRPVARIVVADEETDVSRPCRLGTMKGTVLYMAPDFNDTPEGFEEYM